MFYTVLSYYILFRISETILNSLCTRLFRKIFTREENVVIGSAEETQNVSKTQDTGNNKSMMTISRTQPIVIPAGFENWGQLEKARWITLYAVDTMFRTLTPLFMLIDDGGRVNKKRAKNNK
jgi:hypothetical protein